ncbi:aminotransferase class I/II-fold pyridoxal phosphate-dependent enzyme [Sorangium sp. So ce1128]
MGFNLDLHLRSHEAFPTPEKRLYAGKINLSSNELSHAEIGALFSEFMAGFDPARISLYPYHREVRARAAAFFGVADGALLLAAGSDNAIQTVAAHVMSRSGSLILQSPNYKSYGVYAALNGVRIQPVPALGLPAPELAQAICSALERADPSTVVVTNPEGFTGGALPIECMRTIAETCHRRQHLLVIDEAYTAFSDLDHTELLRVYDNVLLLRSLSKAWGAAGLRLAVVLGSSAVISYLRKFGIENTLSTVSLGFLGHLIGVPERVARVQREVRELRDRFARQLAEACPRWAIHASQANFVTVDLGDAPRAVAAALALGAAGFVVKGFDDVPELAGCIRTTIAEERVMERVLDVLVRSERGGAGHHE